MVSICGGCRAVLGLMLVGGLALFPALVSAQPSVSGQASTASAGESGYNGVSVWSAGASESSRVGVSSFAGQSSLQTSTSYSAPSGGEAISLAAYTPPDPVRSSKAPAKAATPDLVLVEKAAKKLMLIKSGQVIREYPIALGKNPVGHKREMGDGRTPEGRYTLDWRNPESKFYRSIHISYPNQQDIAQAQARNKHPGEHIMIHGSPAWVPSVEWAKNWLHKEDWTEGCIAVTNDIMDEIWNMVADGTPIEIRP
jgi:lipoprotein-anchoring transpeptidase ErfK/SrfK